MTDTDLRILAERFRTTIEALDRSNLPVQFRDFPRGSCGDTADLLGTYLSESGHGEFTYVSGWRGDWPDRVSHAWLCRGDLIIDITADQFDQSPVMVTCESEFHQSFDDTTARPAGFRAAGDAVQAELALLYRQIVAKMDAGA